MKRYLLCSIIFLAAFNLYSQECGSYIELLGKGIAGLSKASISIPDYENVDYVIAEAIYKSSTEPAEVDFSTGNESILAGPVDVPISGTQHQGVYTSVYRARFDKPAEQVDLDILNNITAFYSYSL